MGFFQVARLLSPCFTHRKGLLFSRAHPDAIHITQLCCCCFSRRFRSGPVPQETRGIQTSAEGITFPVFIHPQPCPLSWVVNDHAGSVKSSTLPLHLNPPFPASLASELIQYDATERVTTPSTSTALEGISQHKNARLLATSRAAVDILGFCIVGVRILPGGEALDKSPVIDGLPASLDFHPRFTDLLPGPCMREFGIIQGYCMNREISRLSWFTQRDGGVSIASTFLRR